MPNVIAHLDPYPFGDSAAGIARAVELGSLGIDLNCRTCRSDRWRPWRRLRVVVVVHWAEWWRHGFEPMPGTHVPHKPIEQLTETQVGNLWSIDGHHRIQTGTEAIDRCAAAGLIPCLELKPSKWPTAVLRGLAVHAAAAAWPVVTMTIQAYGRSARARARWEAAAHDRMARSRFAGLYTMLLWREPVNWPWWGPVLDAVKDHPGHGQVITAHALLERLHADALDGRAGAY